MSQAAEIISPSRDHNNPPELLPVETVVAAVKEEHFDLLKRIAEVAASLKSAPEKIEDDDTQNHVADILKAARKARTTAEGMRKLEIEPWETRKKAVDAVFKKPSTELKALEDAVRDRLTAYQTEQADKARIEAERKAEEARQEEERLRKEAEEADAKRIEAERLRVEEERRAAEAQAERERAAEAARREEERARQAKEETARIERERKEREAEEAKRREEEAARQAEVDEQNRLAQIAREREERERRDALQKAREAEEARLAELKKEREDAEAKAKAERETAKEKLEERRDAEQNIRAAKTEERAAKSDAKVAESQADRTGKAAVKQERIAGGSASDLSRGRSDLGTVSTITGRWTVEVTDYDALPIDVLRPFIAKDALDSAAFRYMQTLTDTQKKANDVAGIVFDFVEEARVL